MSITDGTQAMINRIVTMSSPPNIVLPNGPDKDLPRFVVMETGGPQQTMGLTQDTDSGPEIVVRVETPKGAFSVDNNALVKQLVQRFAVGDRFDGVFIERTPNVRPPVSDDEAYVIPVIITGRYFY